MWFVLCVSVVWLYDSVSTNLVLVLLATAAYVSTVLVLPKVVLTVPLQMAIGTSHRRTHFDCHGLFTLFVCDLDSKSSENVALFVFEGRVCPVWIYPNVAPQTVHLRCIFTKPQNDGP